MAKPIPRLSPADIALIVDTAWNSPDPLTAVLYAHGLSEGQLVQLLRRELTPTAYKMWAQRMKSGGAHQAPKRDAILARGPAAKARSTPRSRS